MTAESTMHPKFPRANFASVDNGHGGMNANQLRERAIRMAAEVSDLEDHEAAFAFRHAQRLARVYVDDGHAGARVLAMMACGIAGCLMGGLLTIGAMDLWAALHHTAAVIPV